MNIDKEYLDEITKLVNLELEIKNGKVTVNISRVRVF